MRTNRRVKRLQGVPTAAHVAHQPYIEVGVLVAHTPQANVDRLKDFTAAVTRLALPELEEATGADWTFHEPETTGLAGDDPRRPSDFLDAASLLMTEGPFDFVLVVTDASLVARGRSIAPGLASFISRVAVVSTKRLITTSRGIPSRELEAKDVRMNAAALALHLIGHLFGMGHGAVDGTAMAPFHFDENRTTLPPFDADAKRLLRKRAHEFPEPVHEGSAPGRVAFHLRTAVLFPRTIMRCLWRNRAPLLPLSLPSLATAAVAPTFLLVFTAEIWDAGLNMSGGEVTLFATLSILAATFYLTFVQDLFFPREEKRRVTQHMALTNVVIFLTVLLAIVGLYVMVGLLMLFVETYIFPPDLISTWPTLEDPVVDLKDKVRLATFISVIGVLTGALAGGLESRIVIRHLALFRDRL